MTDPNQEEGELANSILLDLLRACRPELARKISKYQVPDGQQCCQARTKGLLHYCENIKNDLLKELC